LSECRRNGSCIYKSIIRVRLIDVRPGVIGNGIIEIGAFRTRWVVRELPSIRLALSNSCPCWIHGVLEQIKAPRRTRVVRYFEKYRRLDKYGDVGAVKDNARFDWVVRGDGWLKRKLCLGRSFRHSRNRTDGRRDYFVFCVPSFSYPPGVVKSRSFTVELSGPTVPRDYFESGHFPGSRPRLQTFRVIYRVRVYEYRNKTLKIASWHWGSGNQRIRSKRFEY